MSLPRQMGYSALMDIYQPRTAPMDEAAAEELAIAALGFVAADPVLLPRFLALSGIEAGAVRQAAGEPGFLAGVLQFVRAHEPTLAAFCAASGTPAHEVAAALRALPFGDESFDAST